MAAYFRELRKRVGNETILVPATSTIVVNERGAVLLTLRSDDRHWALPGGSMDLGETVHGALERELREEVGIEIHDPELIGVYSGPEFESTQANGERTASVTLLFLVRRFDGRPRGSDRSLDLAFHPVDSLPEPLREADKRFIADWIDARHRADPTPLVL